MTDHPKPIALEVDGKQWEKIDGRWKYRHRRGWVVPPETVGVFLDAIADRDARIAELENFGANLASEKFGLGVQLDELRTAIEAKAARFKQQAKDAKDAGDVAWAAMCLGASSDLLAILKKSGERADGVE